MVCEGPGEISNVRGIRDSNLSPRFSTDLVLGGGGGGDLSGTLQGGWGLRGRISSGLIPIGSRTPDPQMDFYSLNIHVFTN